MEQTSGKAKRERPRRGCFGCLVTSSLGCGAFLLGSIVAAGLFAPRMLAGPAADLIERYVSGAIDGSLQIEAFDLSWSERQAALGVKLLDPQGTEVLVCSVHFPSLGELLDDARLQNWLHVQVILADIRVDENGVSNLARALGTKGTPRDWRELIQLGDIDLERGIDQPFPYRLEVAIDRYVYSDQRDRDSRFTVADASFELDYWPGGSVELTADGSLGAGEQEGAFQCAAHLEDLRDSGGEVDFRVQAQGLPTSFLVGFVRRRWRELPDGIVGLFEADFSIDVRGKGELAGPVPVSVSLDSGALDVELEADLQDGSLVGQLDVELIPTAWMCERAVEHFLPAGTRLEREPPDAPWTLRSHAFELGVGFGAPESAARGLEAVELRARVEPAGIFRLVDAAGGEKLLELRELDANLSFATREPLEIGLDARVSGPYAAEPADDRLRIELSSLTPVEQALPGLMAAEGRGRPGFELELTAASFPTRLLDRVASREGLLVRLFGDSLERLRYRTSELGADGGSASLDLSGGRLRQIAGATLEDGLLRGEDEARIVLAFDPEPEVRDAIVTPLLPWIVDLSKPSGTGLVLFELRDFALPLDGDLSRLDASITMDLGEVDYWLHAGFQGLFDDANAAELQHDILLPVTLRIEGGVVRYRDLTLKLAGDDSDLTGTLNLLTDEIALEAEVPMRALGTRLGIGQPMAAKLVDNDVTVEVSIAGRWQEPRVRVDTESVSQFFQRALPLLQKALENFAPEKSEKDGG